MLPRQLCSCHAHGHAVISCLTLAVTCCISTHIDSAVDVLVIASVEDCCRSSCMCVWNLVRVILSAQMKLHAHVWIGL